ncbi:protein of unknown function [Fibrobacter sp. UWCM]|uniref:DUF4417 domain-containing protein n=1 Tax=Fibrobacter sp. UWCM TaxID=1896208 RepID=UPI00091D6FA5|nr:DUF4417 domain-containing protein [Fibrobacter sp. UWCM]SHH24153.1 protein of unknown function [Fibrobacter sp. UWCM]
MRHPIVSCAQILYKGHGFNNDDIPEKLQSFSESLHYPVHDAWVHFYEEDEHCKTYTEGLALYLEHIKKFAGAISLDRSVGWSDNIEDQKNMNRVNKHSRKVFAENGIPYITNVRFGDKKSYSFCFEDIPQNSVLFVGAHGTQNRADYKAVFFAGICATVERLHPKILLIYGSVDKRILSLCIKNDITLVQYLSQCSLAHKSYIKSGNSLISSCS